MTELHQYTIHQTVQMEIFLYNSFTITNFGVFGVYSSKRKTLSNKDKGFARLPLGVNLV